MRISTRGRYGLRAMYELAQRFGDGPVRLETLADRQDLSRKHLHALLSLLKKAGLVRSVRGPGGGFLLTRQPGQIGLGEVLQALEGPLALVHCVPDKRVCDKSTRCAARRVWQRLTDAIDDAFDEVTLEDMIDPGDKLGTGRKKARRCKKTGRGRANATGNGASQERRKRVMTK